MQYIPMNSSNSSINASHNAHPESSTYLWKISNYENIAESQIRSLNNTENSILALPSFNITQNIAIAKIEMQLDITAILNEIYHYQRQCSVNITVFNQTKYPELLHNNSSNKSNYIKYIHFTAFISSIIFVYVTWTWWNYKEKRKEVFKYYEDLKIVIKIET